MNVTQIIRRSGNPNSVDRFLRQLNPILSTKVNLRVLICPFSSRGFKNKIGNLLWARNIHDDVVHLTGDVNYLAFAISSPLITTILDLGMPGLMPPVKRMLYNKLWIDGPVAKSRIVLTISNTIGAEIVIRMPSHINKIRTIYVPADKEYTYTPVPEPKSIVRVLHIATSAHNKNTLRTAQALAGLDVHYRIIGILPEPTKNFLVSENMNWSHASNLTDSDILKEYIDADLVVFPSLYEGFGMPIVEAQSIGRVVLTSTLNPMSEIAGQGAIFVDPYDVGDIRRGILEYMDKPDMRADLIQKGLQNIKRFELDIIADKYLMAYRDAPNL